MAITWDTNLRPDLYGVETDTEIPLRLGTSLKELMLQREELKAQTELDAKNIEAAKLGFQIAESDRASALASNAYAIRREWALVWAGFRAAIAAVLWVFVLPFRHVAQTLTVRRTESATLQAAAYEVTLAERTASQRNRELNLVYIAIGKVWGTETEEEPTPSDPPVSEYVPPMRSPDLPESWFQEEPRPSRALPERPRTPSMGIMDTMRHPTRKMKILLVAALVCLLGALVAGLLPSGSQPQASKPGPTAPSASATAKATAPPVPATKPSQGSSSTPAPVVTPIDPAADWINSDNGLPIWLMANKPAAAALTRWQPSVLKALNDPRTQSRTVSGLAVNVMKSDYPNRIHGQARLLYGIMLIGSGGNPNQKSGTLSGLVPMDETIARQAAKEMGIEYLPAAPTIAAAENNLLIATYRSNKIFGILEDSKVVREGLMALESDALAAAHAAYNLKVAKINQAYQAAVAKAKKNHTAVPPKPAPLPKFAYDPKTDPAVLANESALFIRNFLTVWYNQLDISGSNFKLIPKGVKDSLSYPGAVTSLYIDWSKPTSAEATTLFAQPAVKRLIARANTVRIS